MTLDNVLNSPQWRTQTQTAFSQPSLKRQYSRIGGGGMGSCSALVQRHRFLLTALVLLAFLCTVYLYFAVTHEAGDSCSELIGAQKATCQLNLAKQSVANGKLKFF